jgi:hypothetical protein
MPLGPTALPQINAAVQTGRGAAASVLGQTYDVYRLSETTQTSIISGTPVLSGFRMYVQRITSKKDVENQFFDLLLYKGTCDNSALQLGDVLVQTGYENDGSIFYFAQARPLKISVFVRVENPSMIQRPFPYGGAAAQQPQAPGFIAAPGYGGASQFNRDKLVLVNGSYDWAPADADTEIASVPIGLQLTNRVSPKREPDLPTVIPESRFTAFVPLLPGVELTELAVIKALHADNYEVMALYSSEATGLSGYVCIMRKLAS